MAKEKTNDAAHAAEENAPELDNRAHNPKERLLKHDPRRQTAINPKHKTRDTRKGNGL